MARQYVETAVIGAGQQGCAAAAALQDLGHDSVVFEKAEIGQAWAHERWDSLQVGSGNRSVRFPGCEYDGDDPDGFMPGREVAERLRRYVAQRDLRVVEHSPVEAVECPPAVSDRDDVRFSLRLSTGDVVDARNVVAAMGGYVVPRVPDAASDIDPSINQMHSRYYRNPAALPDGAVLVVGAGISGQQIADELADAGRRVYMSVGRHRIFPRSYRGRDMGEWMYVFGLHVDYCAIGPTDGARLPGLPVIGVKAGAELNLGTLADKGVMLVGSVRVAHGARLLLKDNVIAIAEESARSLRDVVDKIDAGLRRRGFTAGDPHPRPDVNMANIADFGEDLDLTGHGITSVIWCTGFGVDYRILPVRALDGSGAPVHDGIFGTIPGLYYAGLPDADSLAPTAIAATVDIGRSIADQIRIDAVMRSGRGGSVVPEFTSAT